MPSRAVSLADLKRQRLTSGLRTMTTQDQSDDPRFISRLTRETLALILAGGQGSRLYELTNWRAKPALYFGGKYRIIDFPLSNCINSGIRRMGVLTQYKAHSLIQHLVHGWSWFQAGRSGGLITPLAPRKPSCSV